MTVCPNCGNQAGEGAVFCDQCGARLPAPEIGVPSSGQGAAPEASAAEVSSGGSVICTACGAGNVPGEAFCDFCGSPLEAPVPTVEAAPAPEPVSGEAELEVAVEEGPAGEIATPVEEDLPQAGEPVPLGVELPLTCPACGAQVMPGEAFCADCGASLAQPPIPPEAEEEAEALPEPDMEEEPEPPEVEVAAEPLLPEVTEAEEAAAETVVEVAPGAPSPPPPVPVAPACPACGQAIEPGDKFCSNCGAVLQPEAAAVPAEPVAPVPSTPPSGPRLIVASSGAEVPLPQAEEILIGREDPVSGVFPDVDLTPHGGEAGGVSRRHAQLVVEGGQTYIEDLDSTNYTFVNKQKLVAGSRLALKDGDEIRCGRVALVYKA